MKKAIFKINFKYITAILVLIYYAAICDKILNKNLIKLSLTSILVVIYMHIFEEKKANEYRLIFFIKKLALIIVIELLLYLIWKLGLIKEPFFYIFLYLGIIFFRVFLKNMAADYTIKKECQDTNGSERVKKIKEILNENSIRNFSIYILSELNGIMAAETGIFQKKILFTKKSIEETDEEQFYSMIFHEIAHIKRGDFLKKELIFYLNKIVLFLIIYTLSRKVFFINSIKDITVVTIATLLMLQLFHMAELIISEKIEEKSAKYGEYLFNRQYKLRNERKNGI